MSNKLNLTLLGSENYFINEAYNVLRTNVQFCGDDKRVICVTSVHENEGKTTISLQLAVRLANIGKKVIFVDSDMRKSVAAKRYTDATPQCGLSELLSGQKSLEDCIWDTQYPELKLVFSGSFPPSSTDLLNGKSFKEFIDDCRGKYDYVIIDTPPVGAVIDAAIAAPACDGILLIVAGSKVHARDVEAAANQLTMSGTPILGLVRNFVGGHRKGYYYKKDKYKGYGYGKTEEENK